MKTKYIICLAGCDDTTTLVRELTEDELKWLSELRNEINQESSYGCQPKMSIKEWVPEVE